MYSSKPHLPELELNSDYCTRIFQIKAGAAFYWIGAENILKAISHIPDPESLEEETEMTIRVLTLEEANQLTLNEDDIGDEMGEPMSMAAYFNRHPKCGEMVASTEY